MDKKIIKICFRWKAIYVAFLLSIVIHFLLFVLSGILFSKKSMDAKEFDVIVVDSFDVEPIKESKDSLSQRGYTENVESKKEYAENIELQKESITYERLESSISCDYPFRTPPPLPTSSVFEFSSGDAHSPSSLLQGDENSDKGEDRSFDSGEFRDTVAVKKVPAVSFKEGCRLYILPPKVRSISLEEALSYCEGVALSERDLARKIEFTANLSEEGQPFDVTLFNSSGDSEVDSAAKDLMQFMRFDTSSLESAPFYYIVLVIIGKERP